MKTKVAIKVPVKSRNHIKLPGPCTYCGEPAAEGGRKKWKKSYKLMHWGVGRKYGVTQLWETKDADGVARKGNVTVHAPYCDQHLEDVPLFFTIIVVSVIVLAIAGLIFGIHIAGQEEGETFLFKLFMVGVFIFIGIFAGTMLALVINKLIALFTPAFRDLPTLGNGHWGLSIEDIKVDGGEHGVGPVEYFLRIDFLNIESAQRFLEAYPEAEVVKGKELL